MKAVGSKVGNFERQALTGGTDGEQQLHGIEKEEHDEKRNRGAERETKRLDRVQGLHICGQLQTHHNSKINHELEAKK